MEALVVEEGQQEEAPPWLPSWVCRVSSLAPVELEAEEVEDRLVGERDSRSRVTSLAVDPVVCERNSRSRVTSLVVQPEEVERDSRSRVTSLVVPKAV